MLSVLDDLGRETDEPAFLQSTLVHVAAALEAAGGAIALDTGDGELQSAAESNYGPADPEAYRELMLEAFRMARPRLTELTGGGWMAAAPLKGAQEVLGVLSLHDPRTGCAAPTHTVLEVLSRQIGAGLESLRLNAALRTSAARLEVVHRITTLSADTDIPTAIAAFAREIAACNPSTGWPAAS